MIGKESDPPHFEDVRWWWLSFVAQDQFIGAAIVRGDPFTNAVVLVTLFDHPKGEMFGVEIPAPILLCVPDEYRNRLLTKTECEEVDLIMGSGKQMLN